MAKTITLRINDDFYNMLKKAAEGEHRTISNYIEFAAYNYLSLQAHVSDAEMSEILQDKELISNIHSGIDDYKKGRFRVVR